MKNRSILLLLALCLFSPLTHAANTQTVPNQRELSQDDYALLGKIVWEKMQTVADPEKPDLDRDSIQTLLDQMRRNRDEVNLTVEQFFQLVDSPEFCNSHKGFPGFDLDKPLGPQFEHIIK